MSASTKDTIYIDIDDEITGIIDKLEASDHKIVALVLPKRAAVLQSLVNMKLLKRSAEEAKKNLVLITSEASLMPLAGAVGVHVAKTLQSKPAIPVAPKITDSTVSLSEDEVDGADDVDLDKTESIGKLAGMSDSADEETIEVDNTDEKPDTKDEKPSKKAKSKKLKVPNFNKFRTRLFLGGVAFVLLLIFWYFAAFVMPRATIVVKTNTTDESLDINFSAKPDATEVDLENKIVPSKPQELKKTDSEKAAATGEKDNGAKATGTITIKNCEDSSSRSVSSGLTFSAGGKSYIASSSFVVPGGTFSGGGSVCTSSSTPAIAVTAVSAGESFNQGATTYTTSNSALQGNFKINGSAMTGGTTQIIKVVSQADFDGAKKKIEERTNSDVEAEITKGLEDAGYYVVKESLIVGTPEFTSAPKVGEPASEVTVTSSITYTMTGVKKDDLDSIIKDSVKDKVQEGKQEVQSTGIDNAVIRLSDKQTSGVITGNIKTTVVIGPLFDIENLKKEIAGKKRGQTESIIKAIPGVDSVDIDYSPFWVFSTTKQTGKINITFEQANK